MKKNLYTLLIPALVIVTACSSGEKQNEEVSENLEHTEKIEDASQKSDELIRNAESEFKATQSEIDSLLNDI